MVAAKAVCANDGPSGVVALDFVEPEILLSGRFSARRLRGANHALLLAATDVVGRCNKQSIGVGCAVYYSCHRAEPTASQFLSRAVPIGHYRKLQSLSAVVGYKRRGTLPGLKTYARQCVALQSGGATHRFIPALVMGGPYILSGFGRDRKYASRRIDIHVLTASANVACITTSLTGAFNRCIYRAVMCFSDLINTQLWHTVTLPRGFSTIPGATGMCRQRRDRKNLSLHTKFKVTVW